VFSENPQPIDGGLVCNLRDSYIENFKTTLRQATETSSLKLKTYNLMRSDVFALRDMRKWMARFRTGSHWLEIQQGRFLGPERQKGFAKNVV
jgi:hypothetical protein